MGMFDQQNPYSSFGSDVAVAAYAQESERTAFIRRTYAHLAGAITMFIAIEGLIFTLTPPDILNSLTRLMFGGIGWLLILFGFMIT